MPSLCIFLKCEVVRLSQKIKTSVEVAVVLAVNIYMGSKLHFLYFLTHLLKLLPSCWAFSSWDQLLQASSPISLSLSWTFDWGWQLFQGQFKSDTLGQQLPITFSYALVVYSAELWGFDLTSFHFWQSLQRNYLQLLQCVMGLNLGQGDWIKAEGILVMKSYQLLQIKRLIHTKGLNNVSSVLLWWEFSSHENRLCFTVKNI